MLSRRVFLAIGAAASISLSFLAGTAAFDISKGNAAGFLDMKTVSNSHTEIKRVLLGTKNGDDIMAIFYQENGVSDGRSLVKRSDDPSISDGDDAHEPQPPAPSNDKNNQTLIDMSSAKCTSVNCYPGSFQGPDRRDCDAIAAQQLSQTLSKEKLTAFPGTFVLVYHRTCAIVFQNPSFNSNYALQYKWSLLGNVILDLEARCFRPQAMSIGGACRYKKYKEYEFQNTLISLQRFIPDPPAAPPAAPKEPKEPKESKEPKDSKEPKP